MPSFVYQVKTRIVFGNGTFAEAGVLAKEMGTSGLIVCTAGARSEALANRLVAALKKEGVGAGIYSGVVPNPTTECVNAGAAEAKRIGADFIIGLGGGSSIDVAKAVAVGASHPGEAWEYRLWQKPITAAVLPVLAITTTSGTGAEVTPVAVVTKTDEHCKFALCDSLLLPRIAVVDPELTLSLPASITAPTGFDAFCHAFESTIHKNANPYVTAQAELAMRLVVENLPLAIREPGHREAREALALANVIAGVCIANVGTTLPHGIGMAIGGSAPHIRHGEALAITYPEIARITWRHAIAPYAFMARLFNPALRTADDAAAAEQACEGLTAFLRDVGLGIGFADKGVGDPTLEVIRDDTFGLPDYTVHPVELGKTEVLNLLLACRATKS